MPVKKLAFEVDFDYFLLNFWPRIAVKYHNPMITATTIWTEIYSVIKGSAQSHQYVGWYIPKFQYLNMSNESKSLIPYALREQIFEIFYQYEDWKCKQGGYDLLDVVNYILNQIRFGKYYMTPIHYMMVDEVQDLPHAILLLLSQVTEQGMFFCGDTAQNIAQGVGFRFCDLQHIFEKKNFEYTQKYAPPSIHQLTVCHLARSATFSFFF